MSNININYRSALILKHALKRQLLEKQEIIKSNKDLDEEFLKDYEIERKVYQDFTRKIEKKFNKGNVINY